MALLLVGLAGCGSKSQTFVPITVADAGVASDTGASGIDTSGAGVDSAGGGDVAAADSTAPVDTGAADAGSPDAGSADTGTEDTGAADTFTPPKPCAYDAEKGPAPTLCPVGQVCVGNTGGCTGWVSGTCKPTVGTCPPSTQPVCGCDGKDYANPCEAQKATVTVKSGGTCPTTVAKPCAGNTGKFCDISEQCDVNGCEASDAGICVKVPAVCPDGGTAECGCDGNTYPNACFRQKAKVSKKHAGACAPSTTVTPCKVGPAGKPTGCGAGTYCKTLSTNPIACVGDGECEKIPVVCDNSSAPVCGCDGKTYGNPCELSKAKQNMKQAGQCGSNTCTEGANSCPVGMYCAVPQGQCGTQGICFNKPPATACTGVLDQVCGCDGKAYTNASCAAVQGVVVKSKGACGP